VDHKWRPTVTQGLTLAAVIALLWPVAATVLVVGAPNPKLPAQLVRDGQTRAESAGFALGHLLDDGLTTVSRTSQAVRTSDLAATGRTLKKALADDTRLRALYLVDENGAVLSKAGRAPLRTPVAVPGEVGIHLDESVQRLPVVYAYNELTDGNAVIGEFDSDQVLNQVRRVKGRVRVVDSELRTIFDSKGYVAYQPLSGALAREVAVEALPGVTVGRGADPDGHPALAAAVGMIEPNTVAHLEWAVVVEQDVSSLRLPQMVEHRWILLVAAVVVGILVLTQVWQFYILVRPLRRLAFFADKVSSGDLDQPVPPQRHDDIGAIAICLEICRQVRHTGSARFGGALRLRGEGPDRTTVLSAADLAVRSHNRRATRG
jgi:HAMP domain-containing protein